MSKTANLSCGERLVRCLVDAEVEKAAAMLRLGRYVPAFDHLIPPDVPWENVEYAANQITKTIHSQT